MYQKKTKSAWLLLPIFLFTVIGCNQTPDNSADLPALKDAFEEHFDIGVAVNANQVENTDSKEHQLVREQYNSITPENLLKWERVHPQPDSFNFQPADDYITYGEENEMFVVGHTLIWHRQTPDWVFKEGGETISREGLLVRMKGHIDSIAGRYRGKIDGWDVVNEVFEEDGSYRESQWYEIIGEDYIEQSFRFAHDADSTAQLYYNDFNLWKPDKRDATVNLVENLQSKDIRIDAVGMQSHLGLDFPSIKQIEESILAFSELGVDVMISEIDIDVTRYLEENEIEIEEELPDSLEQRLANRYEELFELFVDHSDKISRVTFWGVNDRQSWLNYRDGSEKKNYPLLFDRENQPKPAFDAVISVSNI